jgi:hypothetical protein
MRCFNTIPERADFAYQCLVAPQRVSGRYLGFRVFHGRT